MEGWNAGQFEAARRALGACEAAIDERTKKALARLAWIYLLGACGMGREGAGEITAPSPRAGVRRAQSTLGGSFRAD
jgi:hypothetical protein